MDEVINIQSLKRRPSMGFKATLFSQEQEAPNNSRQLLTIEKIPFFISPFLNSIFILLNIRIRFTTLLTMLLTYTVITIHPVTYGLLNTLDKTRQLYLTWVAQSAAKLVSLGALGSNPNYITYGIHNTQWLHTFFLENKPLRFTTKFNIPPNF